jgi:1-acyl-sn-glycerol-3-phosphate acyltransferase
VGGEVRTRKLPFFPRLCGFTGRMLFRILVTRVRTTGLEKIPQSGPALVIFNHSSSGDGLLMVAYVIPRFGRTFAWPGKAEALRWPVLGYCMRGNGVFGVRRGASDLESFRVAKSVLDEGRVLAIFPEGTRSRTGAMQEAKQGATVLAVRSGAPVLPIAIVGSQRLWPRGALLPRPLRRVEIHVGDTFTLSMPENVDRRESLRLATVELMRHIAEMLPPEQRGVYAGTVEGETRA